MQAASEITFGRFRLDLANECLWQGVQAIPLRPKAFAVLRLLLEHPGLLVTKQQVLDTVWPETFVGDAVLKDCIRQIREALKDDAGSPSYIETAHRRGYRFIGKISEPSPSKGSTAVEPDLSQPALETDVNGILGREAELAKMQGWLARALAGDRQTVFITGEPGIGKTTLVESFLQQASRSPGVLFARGQCLEHYGSGEAYLPVLDGFSRLCRAPGGAPVVDLLRQHAPAWLAQMPSVVSPSERGTLQLQLSGANRERMLREMAEAIETLTLESPLLLVLEDLHWSDYSTLDLVSYLARRQDPASLLVIGTYRPVDVIVGDHPLKGVKRELQAHGLCHELPLEYLDEETVGEYLQSRFSNHQLTDRLRRTIHRRTEGNPLFMVNLVEYLTEQEIVVDEKGTWQLRVGVQDMEEGVPANLRQLIEKQIERLSPDERLVLEAASVAGAECSAVAIATGLAMPIEQVEKHCEELARRHHFLSPAWLVELPDGTVTPRHRFIHILYRDVLYRLIPPMRRSQIHHRIAEQGVVVYGNRESEIAAELAMHFEQSRDYKRAAKYLQQAADNAIRQFAYKEAVELSRRGLELLGRVPDTAERTNQELCLQLTLGVPLIATKGYAAPEVGSVYLRARFLCQQLGETPDVSEVLWGLWTFHTLRGDLGITREIAEEFLSLAERLPYPGLAMRGHWALEITFMHRGEFALAIEHFEKALLLYDPERHLDDAVLYAQNPGVAMPCFAAWTLWFLGQPDQALDRITEALTLARTLTEPHGLAHALCFAAILHQLRGEARMAQEHADAAINVSREHGLVLYQAMATVTRAWALIKLGQREGTIEQMRQGIAAHRATGTEVIIPHFLALLVEALDETGRVEERLGLLEEALAVAHRTGECYYEAELYRLKGELFVAQSVGQRVSGTATDGKDVVEPHALAQAEHCFHQSIQISQRQRAKSLELRAAMSLAKLYQKQTPIS
jgi:DNA-binding winged helix-turn-helix (wHTH) protein/predicted ATPase